MSVSMSTFTEVPVAAGVLHATADLLDLLGEFLAGADTEVRTQLGRFLAARAPDDDPDPGMQAAIVLHELTEAADLLRTLAGDEPPARTDTGAAPTDPPSAAPDHRREPAGSSHHNQQEDHPCPRPLPCPPRRTPRPRPISGCAHTWRF
jgi:hypothetical protein